MATTADIKNGLCIVFNNDIYSIVEFLHVKPGKGAAFVRTKIKNVILETSVKLKSIVSKKIIASKSNPFREPAKRIIANDDTTINAK